MFDYNESDKYIEIDVEREKEMQRCAEEGIPCEFGICDECRLTNEEGW